MPAPSGSDALCAAGALSALALPLLAVEGAALLAAASAGAAGLASLTVVAGSDASWVACGGSG
jgi:hypothetical protein